MWRCSTGHSEQFYHSVWYIQGEGSSLSGQDWPSICQVQNVGQSAVNSILDRHKNVFREELGTYRDLRQRSSLTQHAVVKRL